MNILIITSSLAPGGAERVVSELANNWSQAGHNVTVVLFYDKPIFYNVSSQVLIHVLKQNNKKEYINKLAKYYEIRKYIITNKPDVVLSLPEEIGIYVLGALIGTNIPVVVSERNNPWLMPYKKITRFLRWILYRRASGIVFQTEVAQSFFSKQIRDKSIVLNNPVDLSRIPEVSRKKRQKIIAGAGRLFKQKNFRLLIDAFSLVQSKHSEFKLVIYGEGYQKEELLSYASSKLPQNSYEFPGQKQNLLELLNNISVFVLSSDFEGMPNVLLEAMLMGVPCVSTDCPSGGPAQIITHGENGFLVPINNPEALAEKICRIIDDTVISSKFSNNARMIRDKFDSNIVSQQWLEFILSCM